MTFAPAPRALEPELVDAGDYASDEIHGNLADLRFFNAWFGGTRVMARALGSLIDGADVPRPASVLDVASGSADIPAALARWGRRRGLEILPIGLDRNTDILREARDFQRTRSPASLLVQADAGRLPCADRSIDFVICSNFMHHLGWDGAVALLREMRRVARRGVALVDLRRTRAAWCLVWLATRLTTRNRLTRHDGPLSVSRAFTIPELREICEEAGLGPASVRPAGPVRMVMTLRCGEAGRA